MSIPNRYQADILDQPCALQDTLAGLQEDPSLARMALDLFAWNLRRVVLTGMGSSYHALQPLNIGLNQAGYGSQVMETSELLYYYPGLLLPDTLLVIASQSGRSAETVHLLEQNQGRSPVLGITNTSASPLAEQSKAAVVTRAGEEATVSSKTYLAQLLALEWVGAHLLMQDLPRVRKTLSVAPDAVKAYLDGFQSHLDECLRLFDGVQQVYYLGRGPSLASAGTAGLITKESTHVPAEAMSCAAFRHGPLEMVGERSMVVVFAGDPATAALNRRLVEQIREMGGLAVLVGMAGEEGVSSGAFSLPPAPERLRPLLEILPVQIITLALAQLHHHPAGVFSHSSKVTSSE